MRHSQFKVQVIALGGCLPCALAVAAMNEEPIYPLPEHIQLGTNVVNLRKRLFDEIRAQDLGPYKYTGDDNDRFVFKVPSLRNVVVTAPYFHGGSVSDLSEAIRVMDTVQLGFDIPDLDVAKIRAFPASLTGQYQGRYLSDSQ